MRTGTDLQKALEREGLTREAFAEEAKVHVSTVYRWLSGDIPERTARYLELFFYQRQRQKKTAVKA